jgi:hypothetical protein
MPLVVYVMDAFRILKRYFMCMFSLRSSGANCCAIAKKRRKNRRTDAKAAQPAAAETPTHRADRAPVALFRRYRPTQPGRIRQLAGVKMQLN